MVFRFLKKHRLNLNIVVNVIWLATACALYFQEQYKDACDMLLIAFGFFLIDAISYRLGFYDGNKH